MHHNLSNGSPLPPPSPSISPPPSTHPSHPPSSSPPPTHPSSSSPPPPSLFSSSSSSTSFTTTLHVLLPFSTTSFQAFLSFTTWLKFLSVSSFKSYIISPPHLLFSHPLVLAPIGFQSISSFTSFMPSILLSLSPILFCMVLYTLYYFFLQLLQFVITSYTPSFCTLLWSKYLA